MSQSCFFAARSAIFVVALIVLVAAPSVLQAGSPLSITVSANPGQTSLPEPGGLVTFSVTITNTGASDVTLTALTVNGSPPGNTTCAVPVVIGVSGNLQCSFTVFINSGPASVPFLVEATAEGPAMEIVTASDSATITITDVAPAVVVTKSASPTQVATPGGAVAFTVNVTNEVAAEPLTMSALVDDVHGDLNNAGTCKTPVAVNQGQTYTCTYNRMVTGNPGDSETSTTTATVGDNEGGSAMNSGAVTVDVVEPTPQISVTKTADPTSLAEPGGNVTFTVRVDNASTFSVDLTALSDDIHGDVDGQGDCSVPQTIAASGFYECSFTVAVTGNAGGSEVDTVTATADNGGVMAQAQDSATVSFTDVLPSIGMTLFRSFQRVIEPGGPRPFVVIVENLSSAEEVAITSLIDSVHGDLDGQGTCTTPQFIAASSTYVCSYTGDVFGVDGDTEDNTVTVDGEDDEMNSAMAEDSATSQVAIVEIFMDGLESGDTDAWTLTINN